MAVRSPSARALCPSLLALALAAASGCSSRVGTLQVSILASSNPDALSGVSRIRVSVEGPDVDMSSREFPRSAGAGSLDDVPVGDDRRVVVEGINPVPAVVSVGRSRPLTISPGENKLELFLGLRRAFSRTPSDLGSPRAFHTASLLPDGSVALVGGTSSFWRPDSGLTLKDVLSSVEILHPDSLAVSAGARLPCNKPDQPYCLGLPRVGHTTTLLESGSLVVAGGTNGLASSDTLEVLDPQSGLFSRSPSVPSMRCPRAWHQAGRLSDGVALLGGVNAGNVVCLDAYLYEGNALKGFFPLKTPRRAFSLVELRDGSLLAAGGLDEKSRPLRSIEILRPGATGWSTLIRDGQEVALQQARAHHTATLLADGSVLFIGGLTERSPAEEPIAAELVERIDFLGQGPSWHSTAVLSPPRWAHSSTLLTTDEVLVVGGFGGSLHGSPLQDAVLVQLVGSDAATIQLTRLERGLLEPRAGHAATRLQSDMVLITGGVSEKDNSQTVLSTAEVFVY